MPDRDHRVRAHFDDSTVVVYQAYSPHIADAAVTRQTLAVSGFKRDRMTWIKPSFLWMMCRSGWATKPGQERVLAITITREGFDWGLERGVLSQFDATVHGSHEAWKRALAEAPVRIQWDPDRDFHLERLERRAVQIGLAGDAVERYLGEWIRYIEDITEMCRGIKSAADAGDETRAPSLLPEEQNYPRYSSDGETV